MHPRQRLSALLLSVVLCSPITPSYATGIPTFDGAVLAPSLTGAISTVAQQLKQVEQYRLQLQQYINMLQNTMNPGLFVWDDAVTTMNDLRYTMDTLQFYKSLYGNVSGFTGNFHDLAFYRTSRCFTGAGCSPSEWGSILQNEAMGAQSQKQTLDAMFKGLDRQQGLLGTDARQLKRLQTAAQGAGGQVQAQQYANMLQSQEVNQLLQIRTALLAQQTAEAARLQAIADREARERAAGESFRRGTFQRSTGIVW